MQEENDIPDEMFKSMTLVDDEGEMVTTKVDAGFVNGKPKSIEATLEMTTPGDWDRFMRFMERYAESNDLGFTASDNPSSAARDGADAPTPPAMVPASKSTCLYGALSADGDECWIEDDGAPPP